MNDTPAFDFASALLAWFDQHGRSNLPWQQQPTPYRVWISEIMLQQTQVDTVVGYFDNFMQHFPDLKTLADAPLDAVLAQWSGLGYYARARNLYKAAQQIVEQHNGELPADNDALIALPGIGRSTAGAILSLAYQQRAPILDGNVKRVLARYFTEPGWPGSSRTAKALWLHAENLTPHARVDHYTQAMMDLGATVCTRTQPDCNRCPLSRHCRALHEDRTDEFPARKPKITLPVRSTFMLLLQNSSGEVLLEKRPPSGIWGGLLSLPMFEDETAVHEWCQQRCAKVAALPGEAPFRHSFSHFHLDITPLHRRATLRADRVMEATGEVWYKGGTLPGGLATPVSRLLTTLFNESKSGE